MWRCLSALLLTLLASGCGWIPSEGPTASDVANQAKLATQPRYEVIDLDLNVAHILSMRAPDKSLASFGDYRSSAPNTIEIGDTVSVTIWEAAAGGLFSSPVTSDKFTPGAKSATIPDQVIGRDAMITVPYAGQIHVAGLTTAQVQGVIERALKGKAIEPQALVTVTHSVANTAAVLGEVVTGARVPLSPEGDRVLDVIAAAGGVKDPVNEAFVELMRGKRTARVALTRIVVDHRENIFVRPNDVLTVVRDPQRFMAYGATGQNTQVPFDADGINLNQAITMAGGLLDNRSDPAGVFIFRLEPESIARKLRPDSQLIQPGVLTPIVYRLNLRDPYSFFVAQQFPVFNNDLIYVSNSTLADIEKVVDIFTTSLNPAASTATVYSTVK
jgi:polysaccharide biosynthesis/export protein